MTNDGGGSGAPRFDVVLRGYDRRQVDEHVARLQRIIGRLRADLEAVRSQPLPIVSPAQAGIPASDPNGNPSAARPGEPDVVGTFSDRMQSILQAAEEEAAEIRRKAHETARSELQAARAEVADLVRQRDIMITELNRLRGQLENMLSAPTAKMAPVIRNGSPSPTRRDGKPRPSPTPRSAPSPIARQAPTGPQQAPADPNVTAAAPAVPEPVPANGAAVPHGTNGALRNGSADPAPPTAAVTVADTAPPAEQNRAGGKEDPSSVDVTVKVAAVRPEAERAAEKPSEAEAHSSSRSG
ncbi:hypothetical protein SAMN05443637_10652 [Pseudonocardia thermophila]|jgi:hypothetical protein|uniref:DivIVA protein n=1 Tax=Pseudonocardia thermophila TaxID=1848 RepID=A0A1M6SBN0_PSETH|nr:DivIVA domain-containing protein [Pseudonocardia thermophila]SHK42131.1 hypothetical protein SAMN05443637_10652 [Pseudonocardia thermophila]